MKANVLWVAMAALLLAGAAPADALLLCAKVDKVTGEPKDGSPIKLRSACKAKGDGTPVEVSIGSTDDLVAIAANAAAVDANTDAIAEKADQASVEANTQAIAANAGAIADNALALADDLRAIVAVVEANAQGTAANASGISANSAAISTNTGRVQSAANAAAANAGAIADNALALADKADQADVDANTAEIATKANGRGVIGYAEYRPYPLEPFDIFPWDFDPEPGSYNQSGGVRGLRRTQVGRYSVYFVGLGGTGPGHVRINYLGYDDDTICEVYGSAAPQYFTVRCSRFGGYVDAPFSVLVVE